MAVINNNVTAAPYIEILVQPQQRFRFRYVSEVEGSHGSLLGEGTERGKKIYISAKLHNFHGKASMRVTMATVPKNSEYRRRHAHQLSGNNCTNGVCMVPLLPEDDMTASLQKVWITHIARKNLVHELKRIKQELIQGSVVIPPDVKRQLSIEATEEAKTMDLNSVCLCFEAVVFDAHGVPRPICAPAYSTPIYNLKSTQTGELRICRISKYSGLCKGNDEVWILVEKVKKGNIQVKFFEEDDNGDIAFSENASFQDTDVHRQHAIVFRTPPYKDIEIKEEVKVKFQLVRPSDNATSDPVDYVYRPTIRVPARKRTTTCMTGEQTSKAARIPSLRMPSYQEIEQQRSLNTPDVIKLVDQWSVESGVVPAEASAPLFPPDSGQIIPTFGIPSTAANYVLKVECTSSPQYSTSPVYYTSSPVHPTGSPNQGNLHSPPYNGTSPGHLNVHSPGYIAHSPSHGQSPIYTSHIQSPNHFSTTSCGSISQDMIGLGSPASYSGSSSYPTSPAMPYNNEVYPPTSILNSNDIIEGLESIQMLEEDLTTDFGGKGDDLTTDGKNLTEIKTTNRPKKETENKRETQFFEVSDSNLSFLVGDVLKKLKPGHKNSMKQSFEKLLKITTVSGNNIFHLAVYQGATPLVRLLLGLNPDIGLIYEQNYEDKTPVDIAVENGYSSIVGLLMAARVSVNEPDSRGDTAIHKAAARCHVAVLVLLLRGATLQEVNKRNYDGCTPLSKAINAKCVKSVEALLDAGASVTAIEPLSGYTPLHEAVDAELPEICRLLCFHDEIDGELEAFSGLTAYGLAVEKGNEEIITILQEAGLNTEEFGDTPTFV